MMLVCIFSGRTSSEKIKCLVAPNMLAEEVTQFMTRREKYFVKVEAQEENPVKEHESREKDEEQAQQQWEKYSIVENQ